MLLLIVGFYNFVEMLYPVGHSQPSIAGDIIPIRIGELYFSVTCILMSVAKVAYVMMPNE